MTDKTPWCCTGWTMDCALCDDRTGSIVHCPGHPATDTNIETVRVWQLHARHAHPDYEYATTRGPRKQWDDPDRPPLGDDGEPQAGWEANTAAGRDGWERFDYHEEAYWRRLKNRVTGPREAESASPPIGGLSAPICPEHQDGAECPCPSDCGCCKAEPAPHFHLAPAGLREQIVATLEALPVAYWTSGSIASRIMPVIGAAFDLYRDTRTTPDNPAASADAPDPGTLAAIARIHADAIRSLHKQTAGRLDDHDARLLRGLDEELAKVLAQLGEQAAQTTADDPAGDDGPSIAECAADDRTWDLRKAGE